MRNRIVIQSGIGFLAALGLLGCTQMGTTTPEQNQELSAAYQALEQGEADLAIQRADDFLHEQPGGPGSAEAMYIKGRAYERMTASNPAQAAHDLAEARSAYEDALEMNPSIKTEGYIRASLANVAFFQDDFLTVLDQAKLAQNKIDSPNIQAELLFRCGVSQQRLGRFPEADQTFDQLQLKFPDSPPAQQARQYEGIRSFFVQLAIYDSAASADSAADSLRTTGQTFTQRADGHGRIALDAGPYDTYATAKDACQKFAVRYPQALVVP